MANPKEEAEALIKELGITDVSTKGLNAAETSQLVTRLRAEKEARARTPDRNQSEGQSGVASGNAEGPGATAGATRTAEAGTLQKPPPRPGESELADMADVGLTGVTRTVYGDEQPAGPPPNAPMPVDGADDGSEGGPPKPKAPPVQLRYPYQVAPGKSITSVRGIIDAGEEVKATDFVHNEKDADAGKERLKALVKQGVVLERDEAKAAARRAAAGTSGEGGQTPGEGSKPNT